MPWSLQILKFMNLTSIKTIKNNKDSSAHTRKIIQDLQLMNFKLYNTK